MGISVIEQNNGEEVLAYQLPDLIEKDENDEGDKEDNEENYDILGDIGGGSFSKVLKVKSKKNFGIFAMKKVDLLNNKDALSLEIEGKILPQLNHPNIVKCYKVFKDKSKRYLYFIMELMNNGDLESFKTGFENLETYPPEEKLWKIFYGCLKGLVYLHSE